VSHISTGQSRARTGVVAGRSRTHALPSCKAPAVRPLARDRLGVAPTLNGLAGTWAMDPEHAVTLAGVARGISAGNC
jgi:hypothetical protein